MDIASLVLKESELQIVDLKTSKPIGIKVMVRSPESSEIRAINRKWQNRMLEAGDFEVSSKTIDEKSMDIRLSSISSWEWGEGLTFDGKKPDNTDEFKKFVLSHDAGWVIRDQIDTHFRDKANFTKGLPEA